MNPLARSHYLALRKLGLSALIAYRAVTGQYNYVPARHWTEVL